MARGIPIIAMQQVKFIISDMQPKIKETNPSGSVGFPGAGGKTVVLELLLSFINF